MSSTEPARDEAANIITAEEAERRLRARVASGGRLVRVQRGEFRAVRRLQQRCHARDLPALVVPAPGAG